MRIIDAHVHLYPAEINRAPAAWAAAHGEPHWARLCTRVRRDGSAVQAFPGPEELLREMDAAGVARAVLTGWYWQRHDNAAAQNRFFSACLRAWPDRFSAWATLHPAAGEAAVREEILRARDEGFCGLGELSPHSQGVAADDPAWPGALALAGELGLPVNLHVTEPAGKNYPGRVETPLGDFVRWALEFPRTKFVLAHWGARLPLHPKWGGAARACANLFYDCAASALLYDAGVFREMIAAAGADRVMYGSDFPLNVKPGEERAARLGAMLDVARTAGLAPEELAALLGGNARRVLGVK